MPWLITPGSGSPSWWINVYCVNRTDPHLPWDERRVHPDSEVCGLHNLDNYFHRWMKLRAGWWSGHLRAGAITCKHRAQALSPLRNLVLHRSVPSVGLACIQHTHARFHFTALNIQHQYSFSPVFGFMATHFLMHYFYLLYSKYMPSSCHCPLVIQLFETDFFSSLFLKKI